MIFNKSQKNLTNYRQEFFLIDSASRSCPQPPPYEKFES